MNSDIAADYFQLHFISATPWFKKWLDKAIDKVLVRNIKIKNNFIVIQNLNLCIRFHKYNRCFCV